MAEGDRYHYDRAGKYVGKTSSKAPSAGGGCLGLALVLGCIGFGIKNCEDEPAASGAWTPDSSYTPAPAPAPVLQTQAGGEPTVAPQPAAPDVFDEDQACEWASLAGQEIEGFNGQLMCFRDKDAVYRWRDACRPGLINAPEKHRLERRRHWCLPK
jgi:hypothetical protein